MRNRTSVIATIFVAASLAALGGCAVHDDHQEEPAPNWWPAFLYKPTTHPTQEEYDQAKAGALVAPATVTTSAQLHDVRTGWDHQYAEHPVAVETTPDALARPVQTESPAAATLYPNRGQAALAGGSPTLYPPNNQFNSGPARTASIYPRGPLAPTGYLGR